MPLIHTGLIEIDQRADDRRVEFTTELMNKDYIRRFSGDKDVSFRTGRLKTGSMPVISALRELAEDGVEVGDEIIEHNHLAHDLMVRELAHIFDKTAKVGFSPKKSNLRFNIVGAGSKLEPVAVSFTDDWAFYPVHAMMLGYEVVVIFRAWLHKKTLSERLNVVNKNNSVVFGLAYNDIGEYCPELKSYMDKLAAHANSAEHVKIAFEELFRMLRPKEARQKALAEANKRYEKVENFGTWG